jgi:hypothetical protein
MVDTCLLHLLRHCDDFLQRHRSLLDHSGPEVPASGVVAMRAASDQLARAVDLAWRDVIPRLIDEAYEDMQRSPTRSDPGE